MFAGVGTFAEDPGLRVVRVGGEDPVDVAAVHGLVVGEGGALRSLGRRAGTHGVYQIGDVQARSWIVFGMAGLSHPGPSGEALQIRVEKRQLGFSKTRA